MSYRIEDLPAWLGDHFIATETGCWEWQRARDAGRYGRCYVPKSNANALGTHRLTYQLLVGPIEEGLHLDHLCVNPPCGNPAHLEPVTPAENGRRSLLRTFRDQETHCAHGHEITYENSFWSMNRGSMQFTCRPCRRDSLARLSPSYRADYNARQLAALQSDVNDRRHGKTGYAYGCRCDVCKSANSAARAARKARAS